MNVSDECLRLIAEFEGFSATPYNDPVGHCTVGYGELLHLGNCTLEELAMPPITEEEGRRRLALKAQPYADCVEANSRPLNPHEAAALTSFCYNVGRGGYINSSVRQAVNGGWDVGIELARYVHGTNGITYPGLVRRRAAEAALFNTPWEDEMTPEQAKLLNDVDAGVKFLIQVVINLSGRVKALEAKK